MMFRILAPVLTQVLTVMLLWPSAVPALYLFKKVFPLFNNKDNKCVMRMQVDLRKVIQKLLNPIMEYIPRYIV